MVVVTSEEGSATGSRRTPGASRTADRSGPTSPAGGVHRVRADESARDRAHQTERRASRRGDNSYRGLEVNERALVATLDLVMFPHDSEDRPPRAAEVASLLPVSNSVPNERAARERPLEGSFP